MKVAIVCVECGERVKVDESEVRKFGGRCVLCFRESGEDIEPPAPAKPVKGEKPAKAARGDRAPDHEKTGSLSLFAGISTVFGFFSLVAAGITFIMMSAQPNPLQFLGPLVTCLTTGITQLALGQACRVLLVIETRTRQLDR